MADNLSHIQIVRLKGMEARPYIKELADLRIKVFYDFPYLYQGSLEYETKYLEKYLSSACSFIVLLKDTEREMWVGATTAMLATEIEESLLTALLGLGMDPNEIFYFGESVILPEYRGKGLGKVFFRERENFARSIKGIKLLAFCAVERATDHPLKPKNYQTLDPFWKAQGFLPLDLKASLKWKDREQTNDTEKTMNFWGKYLKKELS